MAKHTTLRRVEIWPRKIFVDLHQISSLDLVYGCMFVCLFVSLRKKACSRVKEVLKNCYSRCRWRCCG